MKNEMDISEFLEEFIEYVKKRLEEQDKRIEALRKEINRLKKKGVSSSVIKVLKGGK